MPFFSDGFSTASETSVSVVRYYKISVSLTSARAHFNYFSVKC